MTADPVTTQTRHDPGGARPSESHAWERWERIWTLVFYGLLAFCFGLAASSVFNGDHRTSVPAGWRGVATLAPITIAFGLWYHAVIGRSKGQIAPVRGVVYLGGAAVLFVVLTWMHPSYMFLPFILYVQLFTFVPLRVSAIGAVPLTFIVWWRGAATDGGTLELNATNLLILVGSLGVSIAVGSFIESIIQQSAERQRLIDDLRVAHTELALAERRAGTESERQRLAAEIHDTLAQGFTSIVLHLEAANVALGAHSASGTVSPAVVHHLDQARQTARESLGEARRLVWALRPEPLELATLPGALRRVAARWKTATGIPANVTIAEDVPTLPPDVEVTLLRVAQEALANTRKHARASRVAVSLSFGDDTVLLDVRDDGIGMPADGVRQDPHDGGGFGLVGMRDRVEALGGTFVIESDPGTGTTIAVAIPIGQRDTRSAESGREANTGAQTWNRHPSES